MTYTTCVFCGASGEDTKITNEHLFPNWVNQVLTPAVVGPHTTYERTSGDSSQPRTWPTPLVANATVRVVCEPCNNRWMKNLEDTVAPLLKGPILGQPAKFTIEQQLDIATWACLKAMAFEFNWSDPPVFTQAERETLRTQQRPPASAQIRIAAIETQGQPARAFRRGYMDNMTGTKSVCVTITIGCFVVQVFGGPGATEHGFQTVGKTGTDYIGNYPPVPGPVSWPPAIALSDTTVVDFGHPLSPLSFESQR